MKASTLQNLTSENNRLVTVMTETEKLNKDLTHANAMLLEKARDASPAVLGQLKQLQEENVRLKTEADDAHANVERLSSKFAEFTCRLETTLVAHLGDSSQHQVQEFLSSYENITLTRLEELLGGNAASIAGVKMALEQFHELYMEDTAAAVGGYQLGFIRARLKHACPLTPQALADMWPLFIGNDNITAGGGTSDAGILGADQAAVLRYAFRTLFTNPSKGNQPWDDQDYGTFSEAITQLNVLKGKVPPV